jgi:hypothetical protein
VSRFNRREHRLVTVLCDGSELVFAPVAHLLVLLRQPPIDRARSASPLPKSPFFVATTLCDVAHFFPISMGLRCECPAHNVRRTCKATRTQGE